MSGLFGSQWTRESVGRRSWCCPRCGVDRDSEEWKLRRYLTLFDRRLISVDEPERYVQCGVCRRTYGLAAVEQPLDTGRPDPPLSEDERAILAVVATVIFADSSVRAVEKRAARDVIRRFTGQDLDSQGLKQVLRKARTRWRDPVQRLRRLGCILDGQAKRRIVAAAYLVSGADREIHREETRLLMQIADALDLPPREVRTAMLEATAG